MQVATPQAVIARPTIITFTEVHLTDQSFDDYQLYATHDNGGLAFIVQVRKDKQHVNIYEASYTHQSPSQTSTHMVEQEITLESGQKITRKGMYYKNFNDREAYFFALIKQLEYSTTPFEVFVGIDNTAEVFPSNAYPILFHGAAVLIRFKESNECWFIGISLGKFTLSENIQALYSPIGNNDVVYAYLMTDTKCYIFEGQVFSIDKQVLNNRPQGEDIFDMFYQNGSLWTSSQFSFESARITMKEHYDNPSVPLTIL